MAYWRTACGNICTQGIGNDRRVEKITSGGIPKFVVCRRCYGSD
jgi:hypothetical protein